MTNPDSDVARSGRDDQFQLAWELHKDIDDRLAARMHYGMVAQSMLLVSFATLFVEDIEHHNFWVVAAEMAIVVFGIWLSRRQHLLIRECLDRLEHLKEKHLTRGESPHGELFGRAMNAHPHRGRSYQLALPVGVACVWVAMFVIVVGKFVSEWI